MTHNNNIDTVTEALDAAQHLLALARYANNHKPDDERQEAYRDALSCVQRIAARGVAKPMTTDRIHKLLDNLLGDMRVVLASVARLRGVAPGDLAECLDESDDGDLLGTVLPGLAFALGSAVGYLEGQRS